MKEFCSLTGSLKIMTKMTNLKNVVKYPSNRISEFVLLYFE